MNIRSHDRMFSILGNSIFVVCISCLLLIWCQNSTTLSCISRRVEFLATRDHYRCLIYPSSFDPQVSLTHWTIHWWVVQVLPLTYIDVLWQCNKTSLPDKWNQAGNAVRKLGNQTAYAVHMGMSSEIGTGLPPLLHQSLIHTHHTSAVAGRSWIAW